MRGQLGQIMDKKIQKDKKNPTAASEVLEQKQGLERGPCIQHPQRGGQIMQAAPLPMQGTRSPLPLTQGVSKGNLDLFFDPFALRVPLKPCLNFSSGLLSISLD